MKKNSYSKIKNKIKQKVIIILTLGFALTSIIAIKYNLENKMVNSKKTNLNTISVNSKLNEVQNTKISWGLKRNNNHEQPSLDSKALELLSKYDGIAIGNKNKKVVYLTFDNGYEAGYTDDLLNVLKENNVKATFFITGYYLNSQYELVKRMIDEGHIVGNHTVNHKSLPEISDEEIKKEIQDLHTSVYEKFNYEMKYIRPPKGEFSEKVLLDCKKLGYVPVLWSFAYEDWDENKQKGTEYAESKIISNVHNGEIILLHANSKDNCNVLDKIIKEIKNMGYEIKPLDTFER